MRRRYRPGLAWLLAGAYLLLALSLAGVLRLPQRLLDSLPATLQHWPLLLAYALLIALCYGGIWARGSFTDGRPRVYAVTLPYGLFWGLAQGLVFLALVQLLQRLGLQGLGLFIAAYLLIAGYTALLHSQFWDIWVSPPHNYSEWNLRKVLGCHTPNLLCGLALLIGYQMALGFVLMQMLALLISATAMNFPPWWSAYQAEAGAQRRRDDSR